MPKKLTFQEPLHHGSTVYRNKGIIFQITVLMDDPGHDLLSCSTFSLDQYGGQVNADPVDHLIDLLHFRADTDQFIISVSFFQSSLDQCIFLLEILLFDNPVNQQLQPFKLDGLLQIIIAAQLQSFDSRFYSSITGNNYDFRLGPVFFCCSKEVQTMKSGHVQVCKNNIISRSLDALKGLLTIIDRCNIIAVKGHILLYN